VPYLLLDREAEVGAAWRRHYDRLHLHTSRRFSGLPFRPMPDAYPRYPSKAEVAEYLEDYARALGLAPELGVEVRRIERQNGGFGVETSRGPVRCSAVVVATGASGEPKAPAWPGLDTFPGSVLHSSEYRNGADFRDRDVLVVGFGNSGGEIALDLVEHGARPILSVRGGVNIVPRDVLGVPVLAIAIPLAKLPARFADTLVWPILKAYYPSYSRLGLRKSARGPFRQMQETGRIPLLDVGAVGELRRGRISVEGDVLEVAGSDVRFTNGSRRRFDAIVFATGYEPRLPAGVEPPPAAQRAREPGLYFCGFYVSPTGMLREIGIEASWITAEIARRRRGSAQSHS
jgi:indole-3-pyruvate monooxygenase